MIYIYVLDYFNNEILEIVIPDDIAIIKYHEDLEEAITEAIKDRLGHTNYERMVSNKQLNIIRNGKAM